MKGIVFSSGFFIAFSIFLIVFGFLAIFQNSIIYNNDEEMIRYEMDIKAIMIADLLIKTKGTPENWELDLNNTYILGLMDSDRKIDEGKLEAFIEMDYNLSKQILNLRGYDYFFRLSNNDVTKGTAGGDIRVVVKRVVIYNNEEDTLELMVWKDN